MFQELPESNEFPGGSRFSQGNEKSINFYSSTFYNSLSPAQRQALLEKLAEHAQQRKHRTLVEQQANSPDSRLITTGFSGEFLPDSAIANPITTAAASQPNTTAPESSAFSGPQEQNQQSAGGTVIHPELGQLDRNLEPPSGSNNTEPPLPPILTTPKSEPQVTNPAGSGFPDTSGTSLGPVIELFAGKLPHATRISEKLFDPNHRFFPPPKPQDVFQVSRSNPPKSQAANDAISAAIALLTQAPTQQAPQRIAQWARDLGQQKKTPGVPLLIQLLGTEKGLLALLNHGLLGTVWVTLNSQGQAQIAKNYINQNLLRKIAMTHPKKPKLQAAARTMLTRMGGVERPRATQLPLAHWPELVALQQQLQLVVDLLSSQDPKKIQAALASLQRQLQPLMAQLQKSLQGLHATAQQLAVPILVMAQGYAQELQRLAEAQAARDRPQATDHATNRRV